MLHIITTGGTIDKKYNHISGTLEVDQPVISSILTNVGFCFDDLSITNLYAKDSLDLTNLDRDLLSYTVAASKSKHILITHGTDTMNISAKLLAQHSLDKVIVFTGSFFPKSINSNDAEFNIGFALGAIKFLKNGVYISMNGNILPHDSYFKVKEQGRFIEI